MGRHSKRHRNLTQAGTTFLRFLCPLMILLAQVSPSQFYLPFIVSPPLTNSAPGLYGRVTLDGSPVRGVMVELRFYNGSSWATTANEKTASDGAYGFLKQPALAPGEMYSVRYKNNSDPERLSLWTTRNITTYDANTRVDLGAFDISTVDLTTPESGATISLPYTFTWNARPTGPEDSYRFHVFDSKDGDPWFITDPPLGHVTSYTLDSLPPGFGTGVVYGWSVTINSPDGGYGEAYYYYNVTFQ